MRLMMEVELHPLQIEHTFPTKNITLLRIAEEANLWGVRIILKRSDTHQIRSVGLQDTFYVVAYFSDSRSEWKITNHEVRHPTCQSHPGIVNFFCSFHRRHNIAKYVKGGSGPYSCMRFYNMLISCKLPQTIDRHKFDHSGDMQVQALRFLNAINDYQQYPAARCDLHIDACMHKRTASLSVEAMNHVNESVRDRSAVDPINSLILLLHLEDKRYKGHVEAAWGNDDVLTPHGS